MVDTVLLLAAMVCAIAYWLTIAILLAKNSRNHAVWVLAGGALIMWPFLLFMSFMQLIVVIPLVSVFITHGYDISRPLSAKTVVVAIGATLAFLAFVGAAALIHD